MGAGEGAGPVKAAESLQPEVLTSPTSLVDRSSQSASSSFLRRVRLKSRLRLSPAHKKVRLASRPDSHGLQSHSAPCHEHHRSDFKFTGVAHHRSDCKVNGVVKLSMVPRLPVRRYAFRCKPICHGQCAQDAAREGLMQWQSRCWDALRQSADIEHASDIMGGSITQQMFTHESMLGGFGNSSLR